MPTSIPQIVVLIPARGGSMGVRKKNIRRLGGIPLIAWSIGTAQEVAAVNRIVVSTNSSEIADVARRYGAEVADRPDRLATDEALVIDAIRYHIRTWRDEGSPAGIIVLLEPTCPFRSSQDVQECLDAVLERGCDSAATFRRAAVNPHRTWKIENGRPRPFVDGAIPWTPRQALPDAYQLNGGAYAFHADRLPDNGRALLFGRTHAVQMPPKRSVDIDSEADLRMANLMVESKEVAPPKSFFAPPLHSPDGVANRIFPADPSAD